MTTSALFLLAILVATVLLTSLAVIVYLRLPGPGRLPLLAMLVATFMWLVGYAMHLLSPDLTSKLFWINTIYLGSGFLPTTWVAFAWEYTEQRLLPRWTAALLVIEPIIINALVWTNPQHHLIRNEIFFIQVGSFASLKAFMGPAFYVHAIYAYTLTVIGLVLVIRALLRASNMLRPQLLWLVAGALVTLCANIYMVFVAPNTGLDITPLAAGVSGAIYGLTLLRYRLLDHRPIAYSAVLRDMREAVIVLDAQNRVLEINPVAEQLLRKQNLDVVFVPIEDLFDAQPELVSKYRTTPQTNDEIVLYEGDGTRHYDLHISTFYGQRGQPAGRIIVIREITARKHAEQEREQLISDLNAYADTVAHDLKTPLGLVMGYTQLLNQYPAIQNDPQLAGFLKRIHKSNTQMLRIIEELLLMASVRTNDDVPALPLDVARSIRGATNRLELLIQEQSAVIHIPSEWPAAIGHTPWVEEVWANYISNAIKYGGTPPVVELGADPPHNGFVRFWVRDNGYGIDPSAHDRLFQPFNRLDVRKAEGYGLGLSVVRRIINKLGGEVGVESAPGQGSTFYFTLPTAANPHD